jgi:small subunit ribosomal protein S1
MSTTSTQTPETTTEDVVSEEVPSVEEEIAMAEPTEATDDAIDDDEDFEALLKEFAGNQSYRVGDVVMGNVVDIHKDHVLVDIGYKAEGLVPLEEFLLPDGECAVQVGDEVEVYIEDVDTSKGFLDLSKDKAIKLKIWDRLEEAVEDGELVEGRIVNRVKGGLTVDIGVKAFLPGSQVDLRPVRNLEKFIGQRFKFKIIKFNKRRGNIVLSRRALLEKEREALKRDTMKQIEEGVVIDGIVKNITEYGCFVDLGGIDGLLHITDMSWGRINHPTEMFQVGDEVRVIVLKFDAERERVSLGLKQIQDNPWNHVTDRYTENQKVCGRVVSMTDYGAFIELEPGIEGLIHVSEMSWTRRIKHPSQMVQIGDEVEAIILDIDLESKRISLGMKQIHENPWIVLQEKYPAGTEVDGVVKNVTNFGLFVGIEDGVDGLVHISDLSWSNRTPNPEEVYEIGQEIRAIVLSIDPERERFSLGLKQLGTDPWLTIEDRFPIGKVVEVPVTKIVDYGAFVALDDHIEGLIHISELSKERVSSVGAILQEGQAIQAKVINYHPEERKVALSIRRIESPGDEDMKAYMQREQQDSRSTLGDVLRDSVDLRKVLGGEDSEIEILDDDAPAAEEVVAEAAEETTEEAAEETTEEAAEETTEEAAEETTEEAAEETTEEAAEETTEEAAEEEKSEGE